MTVFWIKGYEGASISDLTDAMGISRPSLYAAYGNKEELFRKALERYGEGLSSYERDALARPTARAEFSSPVGKMLIASRLAGHAAIRERFERARAEGDLPASADPKQLTHFIGAVVCGMAVLAASGATRKELERVIELAMRAWPQ
jgi:AcrR family transcriptional regulator